MIALWQWCFFHSGFAQEVFIGVSGFGLTLMRDVLLGKHIGHHVLGFIVFVFHAAAADDEQTVGMMAIKTERVIAAPFLHAAT